MIIYENFIFWFVNMTATLHFSNSITFLPFWGDSGGNLAPRSEQITNFVLSFLHLEGSDEGSLHLKKK